MATTRILFAEPFDEQFVQRMRSLGSVALLDSCDEQALIAAVPECDALLVRTGCRVTSEVLSHAKRLRVIGRGGVGLDNIDIDAAKRRNITVVHTPAASTDAVADLTVGLIIAAVRKIVEGNAMARDGRFAQARKSLVGRELRDMTLGIVGMGRIGRATAHRCRSGFAMRVVFNDIIHPAPLDFEADPLSKEELYRTADVVSLHVPLTPLTRGLIGAEVLSQLKPGVVLVNTSRGAVVDSDALAAALHGGGLGAAALDVTDPEPLPAGHALLTAPNTVLTPHLGARSTEALARMGAVVEDVIRVLQGRKPAYPAWS